MLIFFQNSDIHLKRAKDELFLYKKGDKSVYQLNPTAAFLWEQLKTEQSLDDLCQALTKEYQVEKAIALKDIKEFIDFYLQKGLIKKTSKN